MLNITTNYPTRLRLCGYGRKNSIISALEGCIAADYSINLLQITNDGAAAKGKYNNL